MSAVLSPPVQAYRAWLTMRASQCSGVVEFTSMETYLQGGGGSKPLGHSAGDKILSPPHPEGHR